MEIKYDKTLDRSINEDVAIILIRLTGRLFLREVTFPGFRNPYLKNAPPYRADAASAGLKLMVEYNGPYHYAVDNWQRTRNDVLKRRWCRLNGYDQIVVPCVVSKTQLERYIYFRLLTDTTLTPLKGDSHAESRVTFNYAYLLDRELPSLFEDAGRTLEVTESNERTQEYTLRYRIRREHVFDPATNAYLHAYDEGSSDEYGYIKVRFWQSMPLENIKTPRVFHVPTFLFKNEKTLARYLAARILDRVDQATLFWKKANVF